MGRLLKRVPKIRIVSEHDFSRAEKGWKKKGFQPLRDCNRDSATTLRNMLEQLPAKLAFALHNMEIG
jgi:hypothetical protein